MHKILQKTVLFAAWMLASGGLSAGTVFPEAWELDVPDGTDPASFWCAFDRSGETLHVKMDQSRRRDREGCVLKVHWKKFVPFVGTNQVWRLTCRQSASQPMGRNAPEIRLSEYGYQLPPCGAYHVVIKVYPCGSHYRVYLLDPHDEEMRVIAKYDRQV